MERGETLQPGYVYLKTPGFTRRALNPLDKISVIDTFHKVLTDIAGGERALKQKRKLNKRQAETYRKFRQYGPQALAELHLLVPQLDQWELEHQEEVRKMREELQLEGDTLDHIT